MDSKSPSPVDQLVGRRLQQLRREQDLSQEMLAGRLGVTFQQIQKYEKGTNRISAGRLYELARELGTTISYFFVGAEELSAARTRGVAEEGAEFGGAIDQDCVDLVMAFKSIKKPEVRKSILAMAAKEASATPRKKRRRD